MPAKWSSKEESQYNHIKCSSMAKDELAKASGRR
jgi:hypothetical protein